MENEASEVENKVMVQVCGLSYVLILPPGEWEAIEEFQELYIISITSTFERMLPRMGI